MFLRNALPGRYFIQVETEMDKMMKGIKTIVEAELNDSETSVLPEIRFTVERLKVQIQQELKCSHTDKESICQLSKTIEESNTELN